MRKRSECGDCIDLHERFNSWIRSRVTHMAYPIPNNTACTNCNLIYCLTCRTCGQQYVGETKRQFTVRYWEHIKVIENHKNHPVGYHFNQEGHSSLDVIPTILEVLNGDPSLESSTKTRKLREKVWIYRLRSLTPFGINYFG